jgi:hypothetical protein
VGNFLLKSVPGTQPRADTLPHRCPERHRFVWRVPNASHVHTVCTVVNARWAGKAPTGDKHLAPRRSRQLGLRPPLKSRKGLNEGADRVPGTSSLPVRLVR